MITKIKTILFGLVLLSSLNNCVSNPEETQANFDRMNEQKLCMDYLYYDGLNIYQSYRESAIRKRGLDCRPYVEMAAYKYNRDRATWNSLYGAVDALKTPKTTQSNTTQNKKSSSTQFYCWTAANGYVYCNEN